MGFAILYIIFKSQKKRQLMKFKFFISQKDLIRTYDTSFCELTTREPTPVINVALKISDIQGVPEKNLF